MFSPSKWPSEPKFCERYLSTWPKMARNGRKLAKCNSCQFLSRQSLVGICRGVADRKMGDPSFDFFPNFKYNFQPRTFQTQNFQPWTFQPWIFQPWFFSTMTFSNFTLGLKCLWFKLGIGKYKVEKFLHWDWDISTLDLSTPSFNPGLFDSKGLKYSWVKSPELKSPTFY